ncbi:MFS transporter [Algoriphagus aquimarinus]|uniref:MFS transporter n=1 Tax=Algoriphagus aquimarinus TaxID=237018 RepID=A0A5C7AAV9_9BACT|nr:MFS transporter [Algoriphagus aquimarinus]TXE05541.1 MFS transporter [Algoriphagus aquimarinus]
MELEKDLKIQYDGLESEISKFRKWAIFLAFMAFIPFPIAAIFNFIVFDSFLTLADFGGYIGGVASPFGAISGILFVYVAFLGQRQQLLYTQQEIRINQIELRDTRKEIEGQKEQLILQNKQFQIQSFESTFFNLLTHFRNSGPVDMLKKTYILLFADFNQIGLKIEPDGYGGHISSRRPDADQILAKQEFFFRTIRNLDNVEYSNVKNSLNQLLSILGHIFSIKNIPNNHLNTLILNIPKEELYVLFYIFIYNPEAFLPPQRKHLEIFFLELPQSYYHHPSHYFWLDRE